MKKVAFLSILIGLGFSLTSRAETIVALTSGRRLLFFDHLTPGTITKTISVPTTGSEALVAIDFNPVTGFLYTLGASGRLYVVNPTTGATFPLTATPTPLVGTRFGFDFDPITAFIQVTSDADQNFQLNANNGSLARSDTALNYYAGDPHAGANPNVVGTAYNNNFIGARTALAYSIDSTLDILVYQNQPSSGLLYTVGSLGVNTSDNVGFDISQATGYAYASLTVGGTTGLYLVQLEVGHALNLGTIGDASSLAGESVIDIAVPTATRLLNISTRGRVGPGDDVLIGGFISRGGGRVVLRAIGPSLGAFGVTSALPDPVLTLKDPSGTTIATNDDWQSSQAADITATGLAPTNASESVILASLAEGRYTAIVSGKGSATGLALVEVFQLP